MEWFKHISDKLLIWFLRRSSGFAKELTADGRAEQALWRDQQRRSLRALAMRSQQRFGNKIQSGRK